MKRHPALVPLSRQHHDGLALGVMIERGLRDDADPADTAQLERVREQALDLWQLELRGHFEVEEQIVFPAARQAGEAGLVDTLIAEHEAIRLQFEALERAPASEAGPLLDELRNALVRHIRTEERVLFQAMQAAMDQPQLEAMGRAVSDALPTLCLSLGSANG
ncbi:MAG: hemerythrin domain-containing protein [Bryobacterales bacterium]|nr:hemerythrin domain-containing protein [Bryobacterales bacterium]